jgi:hypothetical protein
MIQSPVGSKKVHPNIQKFCTRSQNKHYKNFAIHRVNQKWILYQTDVKISFLKEHFKKRYI